MTNVLIGPLIVLHSMSIFLVGWWKGFFLILGDISCTFEISSCGWKTIVSSENHVPWTISYDNTSSSRQTLFAKEQTSKD